MNNKRKSRFLLSSFTTYFFLGSGTATIARFRVFARVHCEQSLYITRIYDETVRWQADTDVPGFIIIDTLHFHENFRQFVFGCPVYSASPSLEFIHGYFCTPDPDLHMHDR